LARIHEILRTLVRHEVRFVVVGGMSAVLQGAPVNTLDLDIVHERTPENVDRLLDALGELEATYRTDLTGRKIAPTASHLLGQGHQLLQTNCGVLDVLGSVEEVTSYAELVPESDELEVSGVVVRVLRLERLIKIKEKLTRPKDQAMLIVLRATLDEQRRRKT
jgi:predicted nucleotidyltransferase